MKMLPAKCARRSLLPVIIMAFSSPVFAQTDLDGIMMKKNNLCAGFVYTHSSWKNYWEGTFKRENLNLGTVTTQMVGFMGAYGVSDKVNIVFGLPYVWTKSSAGTFQGLRGIQDLSLFGKWEAWKRKAGRGEVSIFGVAGISFPVGDYTPDYLPYSIGLKSRTLSLRLTGDYDIGRMFVSASGTYMFRDNITIDRDNYYTTEMHYTNEVYMPDVLMFNVRAGYRHGGLIAEALVTIQETLGGFDISKNNMPFPGNTMNATMAGVNFKYEIPGHRALSLTGSAGYVVAGRNVGQSFSISAGAFYVLDFSKKPRSVQSQK